RAIYLLMQLGHWLLMPKIDFGLEPSADFGCFIVPAVFLIKGKLQNRNRLLFLKMVWRKSFFMNNPSQILKWMAPTTNGLLRLLPECFICHRMDRKPYCASQKIIHHCPPIMCKI